MSKEIKDILVVNPGSTSTKIAVFAGDGETLRFETNIVHDEGKILEFPNVASQRNYRKEMILAYLFGQNYDLSGLSAVVGRGGMVYELSGGGYQVNEKLCARMASPEIPQHASSLGALLAFALAAPLGIPSYIYDSTMGCDLLDIAKVTGIAEIEKYGATHLLNSPRSGDPLCGVRRQRLQRYAVHRLPHGRRHHRKRVAGRQSYRYSRLR